MFNFPNYLVEREKAIAIRKRYIEVFCPKRYDFEYYPWTRWEKCADGYCYRGYLWDTMPDLCLVDFQEAIKAIGGHQNSVYVMWDIRSADTTPFYACAGLPRDTVLTGSGSVLSRILWDDWPPYHLDLMLFYQKEWPDDLYIFDDSFRWTVVLTHEMDEEKGFERYCGIITR